MAKQRLSRTTIEVETGIRSFNGLRVGDTFVVVKLKEGKSGKDRDGWWYEHNRAVLKKVAKR